MPDSIYALLDPRTDEVRYIGKTEQKLGYRLTQHLRRATKEDTNRHVLNWLRQLLAEGLMPEISILERVNDDEDWREREQAWIAHAREVGWPITNETDGGEGILNPSAKVKQGRAERMIGNTLSAGTANNARLTEDQVRAIRDEYARGEGSYKGLARRYGVHYSTIGYIVQRKTWQDIS